MMGLNQLQLIGNLGTEPTLRYTSSEQPVMNFRMATNTYAGKDDAGKTRRSTQWHQITVWGKRAEGLSKVLKKGQLVYVQAEVRYQHFEDSQGNTRQTPEIIARAVTLLASPQKED